MKKETVAFGLIITILVFTLMALDVSISVALTADPAAIKINVGPSSVPADNGTYDCIFVQLQDASGKPARALQDTLITLSSSVTNIGTVDDTITISKGATYASANFYATFTPGVTNIAAAATGFQTVQATVTTVGPIPSHIALYGLPPILPTGGGSYGAVMVELQDASGYPAKAPEGGVTVVLSCSAPSIGSITSPVIIEKDQTYVIANFTTTATAGTTNITPVVTGYNVKNILTITSQQVGVLGTGQPRLLAYTAPVPADKTTHKAIAILMQNSAGQIIQADTDLTLDIASSAPDIGTTQTQVIVLKDQVYTTASFTTTFKAGQTTITAAKDGFTSATQSITTRGFIPSKLAVYSAPSILPSDRNVYESIQVQLQDSQGRPARVPETPVYINLVSSDPTIGTVTQTVIIPVGGTQLTVPFTATNSPGQTTITAQASGYDTGSARVTTYLIDYSSFEITVSASPSTINSGGISEVTAHITSGGTPVTAVTVTFKSDNGGSFSSTTDQGNGNYKATFTATSFSKATICTITASGEKTGYTSAEGTVQVTVGASSSNPTPNPSSTLNPTNDSADFQLFIKDANGNALSGTTVESVVQPVGVKPLMGVTNASGYITFKDVTPGSYTFTIVRQGYKAMNATLDLTGQPMSLPLTLISEGEGDSTSLLVLIAVIVIVAVVVAVLVAFIVIRRRGNTRIRKLQEMQKQLGQKS